MDIQIPQILFQMVNFFVVTGALTFLLYRPVRKMLEERSNRIEEAQKAAEQTIAEKKNIEEIKAKARKEAEKQAAKMMEETTEAAAGKRKQLLADARKEAEAEKAKILQDAEAELRARMESLEHVFSEAVITATERIGLEGIDEKLSKKILDAELKQLLQHI
jgi:F-type H+-transporting ATPase subunit b